VHSRPAQVADEDLIQLGLVQTCPISRIPYCRASFDCCPSCCANFFGALPGSQKNSSFLGQNEIKCLQTPFCMYVLEPKMALKELSPLYFSQSLNFEKIG
jgi:hypothetical protein